MRRTEANEQMLNKYDPWKIGERMLQQMERQGMSLKAFSHLLQSCSAPPFGNLPRYVSAAELAKTPGEAQEDKDFRAALGLLFLDYAVTAYLAALVLGTSPEYLAAGWGGHTCPSSYGDATESEKLSRVRAMASAVDYVAISRRIREMRSLRGMNVRQLAAKIRVSTSTVAAYENAGITRPQRFSYPVFMEMCRALDVFPDYLLLGCSLPALYNPFSSDPDIVRGYTGNYGYPLLPDQNPILAESGPRPKEQKKEEPAANQYRWVMEKLTSLSGEEIRLVKSALLKWHPEWDAEKGE